MHLKNSILSIGKGIACATLLLLSFYGTAQTPCGKFPCLTQQGQSYRLVSVINSDGDSMSVSQVNDSLVLLGGDMLYKVNKVGYGAAQGQISFRYRREEQTWDNGTIPYEIPTGHSWKKEIELGIQYYNNITTETNVCFVPRKPGVNDQNGYLRFTEDGGFSRSYVGKQGWRGAQDIWINLLRYGDEQHRFRTVLHELGHAIGLGHEHQLPWAKDFIELNANICPELRSNFEPSNAKGLPTITSSASVYFGKYDYLSIMHYSACSGSINGQRVFECKDPITKAIRPCNDQIGMIPELTAHDKFKIRLLYRFKSLCQISAATLFLFDLSGSMGYPGDSGAPKIVEAQHAAQQTIHSINSNKAITQAVGITTFSGECLANPLNPVDIPFTTDLVNAFEWIKELPMPNGSTPLPQAITAAEARFKAYISAKRLNHGKLIVLSDGESTCGPIRPEDVYQFNQSGQINRTYQPQGSAMVKYYTVGFGIAPGSPAERDLQFLAQSTGGKYLNAQNQHELTRAFEKFSRIYVPKFTPALLQVPTISWETFDLGLQRILSEAFVPALESYKDYYQQHPDDCHGAYNLALMLEANEYYKSAVQYYEKYLQLCSEAADEAFVRQQIELLKEDYRAFLVFNKKVIQSDFEYLDQHFQKIQNGESVALAAEFKAFLLEKFDYYQNLPAILEITTPGFVQSAKQVSQNLSACAAAIRRNPKTWDVEATPVLGKAYFNLERLLQTF